MAEARRKRQRRGLSSVVDSLLLSNTGHLPPDLILIELSWMPDVPLRPEKNPPELVIAQIRTMNEFTRTYTNRCDMKSRRVLLGT